MTEKNDSERTKIQVLVKAKKKDGSENWIDMGKYTPKKTIGEVMEVTKDSLKLFDTTVRYISEIKIKVLRETKTELLRCSKEVMEALGVTVEERKRNIKEKIPNVEFEETEDYLIAKKGERE